MNDQNLRKPFTPKEARELGRKGGKKSAKVRKEKKLLSMIYGDIIANQAGIKGGKGFKAVVEEIMNDNDIKNNPSRVALIKEIREATEGSKIKSETELTINTNDEAVASVLAKHGVTKQD